MLPPVLEQRRKSRMRIGKCQSLRLRTSRSVNAVVQTVSNSKPRTYRLPIELIERLDKQGWNTSEFVRQAIIEKLSKDSGSNDSLIMNEIEKDLSQLGSV